MADLEVAVRQVEASPTSEGRIRDHRVLVDRPAAKGGHDRGPMGGELLLVALGTPKQEQLIQRLRAALPAAWMMGVGASLDFVAGRVARAPAWMQSCGLEWAHRLAQEPRRLARRYLVDDLPFTLRLLFEATARRTARRP